MVRNIAENNFGVYKLEMEEIHYGAVLLKNNRHMDCSQRYANEWQKRGEDQAVVCHLPWQVPKNAPRLLVQGMFLERCARNCSSGSLQGAELRV